MEAMVLQVQPRAGLKRGDTRRIRRLGDIPAVIYGKQQQPKMIVVNGVQVRQLHMGNHGFVELQMADGGELHALIKEVQRDPITYQILHIDFHAVSLTEPVEAEVQLFLNGLEKVEKRGGIIQQQLREVRIRCLPADVPEYLMLDISDLDIGDHLTCMDIPLPTNVKLRSEPDEVVVNVVTTRAGETGQVPEDETPGVLKDRDNKGVSSDGLETPVKA
ncbi:50S ribosomal protein L25 [Fodinisporobacter ferrooxydans]|uniref:Large ribosomal subunit protein bL25 n=1 Tax=Fodinisporobacter ferrooxydans TaxID=2901836 RepID=A0ABY4CNH5_9BACL|nr:50S ribosomal protein L25 [Alicyclobacillaceae bacterium MYW30-H2]